VKRGLTTAENGRTNMREPAILAQFTFASTAV
jgi:hypothetical protein